MTRPLASVLVSTFVLATSAFAQDVATQGKPAPLFRLPAYNPTAVDSGAGTSALNPMLGLDRFVGPDATDKGTQVVLLSFMASFCAPCKKEMPYLQALHERYRDRGLRVMMVAIDTDLEGQKKVEALIAEHKVTFPVLKDRFNLVARRWLGAQSPLPSVFLVKPDGVISTVHRGYDQDASLLLAGAVGEALGTKVEVQMAAEPEVKPAAAVSSSSVTPATTRKPRKSSAGK